MQSLTNRHLLKHQRLCPVRKQVLIACRILNLSIRHYPSRFHLKLASSKADCSHFRRPSLLTLCLLKSSRISSTSLEKGQTIVVHLPSVSEENLEFFIDDHSDAEATLIILKGRGASTHLEPLKHLLHEMNLTVVSTSTNGSETCFRIVDQNRKKLDAKAFEGLLKESLSNLDEVHGLTSAHHTSEIKEVNLSRSQSSNSGLSEFIRSISSAINKAGEAVYPFFQALKTYYQTTQDTIQHLRLLANEISNTGKHLAKLNQKIKENQNNTNDKNHLLEAHRSHTVELLDQVLLKLENMLDVQHRIPDLTLPSLFPTPQEVDAAGTGFEVLLQGFNWDSSSSSKNWYKILTSQAEELAQAGFTAIWLPPPSDSVSEQGYLPRDLYNFNSSYGSESELRQCIKAFHRQGGGVKVLADIVINHRCAQFQDEENKWNKFGGRLSWDAFAVCSGDDFGGKGSQKLGDRYSAAPNIDHSNPVIRRDLIQWLKDLKTRIGFDGWRFDFVKGYPGEILKEYIESTNPEISVGEFWDSCAYTNNDLNYDQDDHRQRTIDWVDSTQGTSAAFDFTTKGILQEAVRKKEYWRLRDSKGCPPGMVGLWPAKSFLFIDNHDTGSSLQHWPFPYDHLLEGYAYILTHPGTPVVFYDHFWDGNLRQQIFELLKIRKRNGLNCRSKIKISLAEVEVYSAVLDEQVAMKIGPGDWSPNHDHELRSALPDKNWKLASSGHNYAVWEAE